MRKQTPLLVMIIILSTLLSACAGVASAQSTSPLLQTEDENTTTPMRTISVSGSGVATLTPDIAYVSIGVRTESDDAAQAVSENNALANEVSETIKAMGIDEKDIKTTNFSIHPQQEYDPNGKPTGKINYIVNNTVYVTVRDLSMIGDLLNASVSAGANTINGIQFDVADKTAALSVARKAAVENARVVAEELAESAGVSVGDVQSITTFSSEAPPIVLERAATAMMADSVPVSPGQMNITVQVSVVYQIR